MNKNTAATAFENYPLNVALKGQSFKLRPISLEDGELIMRFARALPQHDLMYMRRDISQPAGVERWFSGVEEERIHSIIAEDSDGEMVGYSTIHQDDLEWSKHVADLRVTVATSARGTGLGRLLIREAFNVALALGVERVTARMTTDQVASRNLFHELGFKNEALLKDHVRDREGQKHDLLIMAVDVDSFISTRAAYGVGT